MTNVLNFLPPEAVPKEADISGALALLVAIGDKSTKATLEKLQAAAAEFRDAAAAAETALAEVDRKQSQLDARQASFDENLAQRRSEHELRLQRAQADHDLRLAERERDLAAREKAVEEARGRNIGLHDDLTRRLALVKQAST